MSTLIDTGSSDPTLGIIEHLVLLESVFGSSLKSPLPKFSLSVKDPVIAVQKAARQIAKHLDLHDLTFIVLIREQDEKVAGRVHIDGSPDAVEVELSPDIIQFPNAVLATLCHEVMHKYLHRHGLKLDDTLSNEKLTDTACVYFGLGMFMLEGCESQRTSYVANGRRTSLLRTGYLTADEFALTFCFVANMAALVGRSTTTLSPNAAQRIKSARQALKAKGLALESVTDVHGEMLARIEHTICRLQRGDLKARSLLNAFSSEYVMKDVWSECASMHRRLRQYQVSQNQLSNETNTALVYLHACRILLELNSLCTYSKGSLRSIRKYRYRRATEPVSEIICPSCDQRLRVSENDAVVNIRCPRCRYRFPVAVRYPGFRTIAWRMRKIFTRRSLGGPAA